MNQKIESDGPLVLTLIGKVNAGKSTLTNALLGSNFADVSPQPGWTKEVVCYPLSKDLKIADTPGLEDIETRIAERTLHFEGESDLFFHVVNMGEGLTRMVAETHRRLLDTGKPVFLVAHRADLVEEGLKEAVEHLRKHVGARKAYPVSSKRNKGVDVLAKDLHAMMKQQGKELLFKRWFRVRWPELEQAMSEEADGCIHWATGRAAAIAIAPIPLADVYPLIANEVYMAKRIGDAYGLDLSDTAVKALMASMGASFLGLLVASFLPGLKIGIAAGVTFAAGKAVKAWCVSGGTMSERELKEIFEKEKKENGFRKCVD
jgi:small GTP-binding protein